MLAACTDTGCKPGLPIIILEEVITAKNDSLPRIKIEKTGQARLPTNLPVSKQQG
jgi:hypothetical protein